MSRVQGLSASMHSFGLMVVSCSTHGHGSGITLHLDRYHASKTEISQACCRDRGYMCNGADRAHSLPPQKGIATANALKASSKRHCEQSSSGVSRFSCKNVRDENAHTTNH